MYMFNMHRGYNQALVVQIVAPIQINHVYSSFSYQWVIYQKYNQRGHASPSGYGPLAGWFCKYL